MDSNMASCVKAWSSILEPGNYIRTCFQTKETQENLRQDGWVSAKSYIKHNSYIILSKISPHCNYQPTKVTYTCKNMLVCKSNYTK